MTTIKTKPSCTVIVTAQGGRCGLPAVATFTSKRTGETFHECQRHECKLSSVEPCTPAEHPPTRTIHPFVLVAEGRIVGYAASKSPAVVKRAAKLHARIIAVQR